MPSPQPEIATPIPQKSTGTFTPTSTFTPIKTVLPPTSIASATATINPSLSPEGPYLAYLKGKGEKKTIVFMNSDGVGRKEILLPADISRQTYDLTGLSPDGKWLTYYIDPPDTLHIPNDFSSQGSYDLSLYLLNLETKESKLVTPLLSADFPNNFQKQEDIFTREGIPSELQFPNDIANTLFGTFLSGIDSVAWSPSGRYLAFAGQMNGLSSDLYVYDMESQQIRQLSSGSEEILWISWSPNGGGILHGATYVVGMGMECRTYIADLDGTSVRYLSKGAICNPPDNWVNDFTYVEYDNENVEGNYHLRSVDIRSGSIFTYWRGDFHTYALDKKQGLIALTTQMVDRINPDNFKPGLYLINVANGQQIRTTDDPLWMIEYFGLGARRFVVYKSGERGYMPCCFLKDDGALTPIKGDYTTIFLAPNQQHWVGIGNKIFVYTPDDTLEREIALPKYLDSRNNIEVITWSPDSSGFYFRCWQSNFGGREYDLLYFLNLLHGEPVLVEDDSAPSYGRFPLYKWISAQP